MTLPESSRPSIATPSSGKPSLMGGPREAMASGSGESTQPMRMLNALETADAGRRQAAPSRIRGWLLAIALTMLAVAAASWWQARNDDGGAPDVRVASQSLSVPSAGLDAVPPASVDTPAVSPPAADATLSSGPASIERTPQADPMAVLTRVQAPTPSPSAEITTTTTTNKTTPTPSVVRIESAPPLKPRSTAAPTPSPHVADPVGSTRLPPTVRADASSTSRDPDVTLLSAMLARLSSDNPGDAAAQRATIANLVERCEARGGKESNETLDCKRQICAGYWGKADACPVALKKH